MLPGFSTTRILLVESNLAVVEQLNSMLRNAGYSVENAYNIGDALAADHRRYALVLVNGTMRDRDGRTALDSLRDHLHFSRLPVIEISKTRDLSMLLRRIDQILGTNQDASDPHANEETQEIRRGEVLEALHKIQAPNEPEVEIDLDETKPTRRAPDPADSLQLAALKTLSALGRSVSSSLDLTQVLNQIVEAATTLTEAEEGLLLLPDEEDKALYLRAMKGIDDDRARNFRIRNDDNIVARVYRTGKTALIGDRGPLRLKTEYFVKSILYVPMIYKGATVGVLGVNNQQSGKPFTAADQELLTDLAAHAAIAIENARLYEDRLLQNRQLTTLVEAGMAVNSTLALPDVLLTICRQVIKAFEANACLVQQRDESGESLRTLAGVWQSAWRAERGPIMSLDERPPFRQALAQNAFYVVDREQKNGQFADEVMALERSGARQLLVLTIRVANRPAFGLMELYYRGPMPEISSEFRAHIRGITLEICASLPQKADTRPSSAIFSDAQRILDYSGASWFVLWMARGDQSLERTLEYGSAVFLDEPYPRPALIPFPADGSTPLNSHAQLNYHAHEEDLPSPVRDLTTAYGAEAILCLPLLIKGRMFGTFTIYNTVEARRFRPHEISLAWAIITQAATAIENARLYHDLAHSLEDLKQAQASLVQAARLSTMGELAAVVAHQINNPLTTVMVDSEIILQDLPQDSDLREGVTAIHRAGQRAHAVVKRLLSTARRSKSDDERQWIEIHTTIRHTLDLVTTHIERSKIRLEVSLDDNVPSYVKAFTGHLEDVWLNLLLNGRDALTNRPNAVLGLVSRRNDAALEVTISDNGPGIPPDRLEAIFEPFFTTKPPGEGTGLGLYICKQVIEQCNGRIVVESKPGQGARFIITLPASTA